MSTRALSREAGEHPCGIASAADVGAESSHRTAGPPPTIPAGTVLQPCAGRTGSCAGSSIEASRDDENDWCHLAAVTCTRVAPFLLRTGHGYNALGSQAT